MKSVWFSSDSSYFLQSLLMIKPHPHLCVLCALHLVPFLSAAHRPLGMPLLKCWANSAVATQYFGLRTGRWPKWNVFFLPPWYLSLTDSDRKERKKEKNPNMRDTGEGGGDGETHCKSEKDQVGRLPNNIVVIMSFFIKLIWHWKLWNGWIKSGNLRLDVVMRSCGCRLFPEVSESRWTDVCLLWTARIQ